MALTSWEHLNTHLQMHSYLGCTPGATLYDYDRCTQICQREIDAIQFPHLMRWHVHISHLINRYGKFDHRGNPLDDGVAPRSEAKPTHFCVLDFEKTCERDVQLQPQEIIEFPSVLIAQGVEAPIGEFESFVRPTHHPTLTAFCTELTGITQQQVDAASCLPRVLSEHHAWLRSHVPRADDSIFVTCGDMDLKRSLPEDPNVPHEVPACYGKWLNIKQAFGSFYSPWKEKKGKQPRNMMEMLDHLKIILTGQHHSGIDDCRNIAKVLQRMLADGWSAENVASPVADTTPPSGAGKKDAKAKAVVNAPLDPEIEARWKELQSRAPDAISGKPTPEQLAVKVAYKKEVQAFLSDVGSVVAKQLQATASTKCLKHELQQQNVSLEAKTNDLIIVAKSNPVSFWDGAPAITFSAVLPFYSHSSRSKDFERIDKVIGIDRRVFSNLYSEPDGKLYRVSEAPPSMGGAQLMRHAFLTEIAGSSSEAFFQSAKCELEADARFIMELSPSDAAKYGQGRLTPTDQQLNRLEELGLKTELGLTCPNPAYRGQDATSGERRRIPPRRIDWDEVKMDVMMHICRCKFGIGCTLVSPTTASGSLAALAASEHTWLLIEHPKVDGDRFWGDGGDGKGANMLGKCLSRIVCEARGSPCVGRLPSFDDVRALNNAIVDYKS